MLDDVQKAALGHNTVLFLTIAVLVFGFFGNLIKQNLPKDPQ